MSGGVESEGPSADDTLTLIEDDERDPEAGSDDPDQLSQVWTSCDNLRHLLRERGDPSDGKRHALKSALVYHVPTLALYEHVGRFLKAFERRSATETSASLYVLLFPGEAKDNTGIKDLNDEVIGQWWNGEFIRARFAAIEHVFSPATTSFQVVSQSYKTAFILSYQGDRKQFVALLAELDERLRVILLDILDKAEKSADKRRKKNIKKLRKKLKKKGYRFDIFFGIATRKPAGGSKLEYTYLLVTEALKAASLARYVAKTAGLKKPYAKHLRVLAPDPKKLDPRGKEFDWPVYMKISDMQEKIKALCMKGYTRDTPYVTNEIYIDTVWAVTYLKHRERYWGHPDVIRDVRKKKVKGAPISSGNMDYGTWAAALLVQVWLVVLNLLDYVKRFKGEEFRTKVVALHDEARRLFVQLGTAGSDIDWPALEKVLTRDVRQDHKIAVYESASEFLFYSSAADHAQRIFFSMDVRDMGVELMLHYEHSNREVGHGRSSDVALMEETFRASDAVDERRRVTYRRVAEVFRKHYDQLARSPGGAAATARKAFASASLEKLGSFEEAVQLMLGGDEVYAAVHPLFAEHAASIVRELDQAVLAPDRTIDLRVSIAFSSADQAQDRTGREKVQLSHQEAMRLADQSASVLKALERTQRRIERLIEMLEANPKKKGKAPPLRAALEKLPLKKVFVRLKHGAAGRLAAREHHRLVELLRAGDLRGAQETKKLELVDFDGKVVDAAKLEKDAHAIESKARQEVGADNVRGHPPPATEMPKWLKKLLDGWADDDDKKKKP